MATVANTRVVRPAKRWAAFSFTLALGGLTLAQPYRPISTDPRLVTILVALLLGISIKTKPPNQKHNLTAPILPAAAAPVILAAWLLLSASWSSAPNSNVLAQIVFICMLMLLIRGSIQRHIDIQSAIAIIGLVVIGVSAFLWYVAPSQALVGGRLNGIMSTPTTLASMILLTTPAIASWRRGSWIIWGISLGMVWVSGSRVALLALLLALALVLLGKYGLGGKFGILSGLAIAAYLIIPSVAQQTADTGAGSASVLRSNNSHAFVWARAWELAQQHLLRGSGLGNLTEETGSSVLAVLIVSGAIGLALAATAIFVTFRNQSSLSDWRVVTVVGGTAGSLTEGWLISAGSIFCAIYWICVVSLIVFPTTKKGVLAETSDELPENLPSNLPSK